MADPSQWKNRIVRYGEMAADQFLAHPLNPNKHPLKQQEATKGSLDTLGWVIPVIVSRNGYLIDGHDRIFHALQKGDQTPVPFIEVDLEPHEESLALVILDNITRMAVTDRDHLEALLQEIDTDNQALQSMLNDLAMNVGIVPNDFNPLDEWVGMPEFEQEEIKPFHDLRLVFLKEDDMHAFARLVGQTVTDKTTMLYYPKKDKREIGVYQESDDEP